MSKNVRTADILRRYSVCLFCCSAIITCCSAIVLRCFPELALILSDSLGLSIITPTDFCGQPPNGMRYLRWGGDGEAVQPEKCSGVENCLRFAQNPQRQVHALLVSPTFGRLAAQKTEHRLN